MPSKQFVNSEADVICNLPKEDRRKVSSLMKWDCGAATILVAELLMRTFLADFLKTKTLKKSHNFAWLKYRSFTHDQATTTF